MGGLLEGTGRFGRSVSDSPVLIQMFETALKGFQGYVRVCIGVSGLPFGHLLALEIALLLALVLVLGVIGGPFGGSGEVREICIKVAGFDTDVRIASEWAPESVGRHARCRLTGSWVAVSNPRFSYSSCFGSILNYRSF